MPTEGQQVGPYELIRKLGAGAFGEVWLARHRHLGVERAMKIPTDPACVKQLRLEGRLQFELHHPNIVRTFDLDPDHSPPYFVMEYVQGESLRDRLNREGKLPLAQALAALAQILEAVEAAHANGVLHRDLKPENILLTPDGTAKVTDFGLGKVQAEVAQSLMLSGSMKTVEGRSISGTYAYMSPEQQAGDDPTPGDDLYALGVVACELLAGSRPRPGLAIEDIFEDAGLDESLAEVVKKALAMPRRRYQSAREMSEAVAGAEFLRRGGEEERRRAAEQARRREQERRRQKEREALERQEAARLERERRTVEQAQRREEDRRRQEERQARQREEAAALARDRAAAESRGKRKRVFPRRGAAVVAMALLGILVVWVFAGSLHRDAPRGRILGAFTRGDPEVTNSIGMKLRLIQPGTFLMGSEKGAGDEKPVHRVTIAKPFYLGVCEVTQEQYEAVMGTNPSRFKGPNRPVESVSWQDAQELCRRLSEREGVKYRLPTEAEWEYACRAGSSTEYCFGDSQAGLGDYAWFKENSGGTTHDAGQRKANAWGLHDMHGNVWEWCADWYGEYTTSDAEDPRGPRSGEYRVLRGGSWYRDPEGQRSALRHYFEPSYSLMDMGVRVACAPQE